MEWIETEEAPWGEYGWYKDKHKNLNSVKQTLIENKQ